MPFVVRFLNLSCKFCTSISKQNIISCGRILSCRRFLSMDKNLGSVQSVIERKLNETFDPIYLEVVNESYKHSVPKGSESHFKVTLLVQFCSDLSRYWAICFYFNRCFINKAFRSTRHRKRCFFTGKTITLILQN